MSILLNAVSSKCTQLALKLLQTMLHAKDQVSTKMILYMFWQHSGAFYFIHWKSHLQPPHFNIISYITIYANESANLEGSLCRFEMHPSECTLNVLKAEWLQSTTHLLCNIAVSFNRSKRISTIVITFKYSELSKICHFWTKIDIHPSCIFPLFKATYKDGGGIHLASTFKQVATL